MFKTLPIALLALLGTCAAQQSHPLTQLQGSSRILMVFAPDANSANFKRQLALIEHHSFELSARNTVVVPVSENVGIAADIFGGEQLPLSSTTDQVYARARFHVEPSDFVVLLLNEDGAEQLRSQRPVDIHELVARLDSMPQR
ncbi:MAG: DUF4174 domain-containing protein [Acidobacteriota bacterium]|nr:DUF4174 domain-containing protein [Acidobacteriota bacterium]